MDLGRSYEPITGDDLGRLNELAQADRERFFRKRPEYRERVVCTALCQGAALHHVDLAAGRDRPNGIKDFDVWTFFSAIPGKPFPANKRITHDDFGASKFGRWDREGKPFLHYSGRRVDLLMRALPVDRDADPARALCTYLAAGQTGTARHLSAKGVVLIDPGRRRGEVIWPLTG